MKSFSFILAAGLAASVEASPLPLCSAVCLTDAIVATGCNAVSTECICKSEVFMASVTDCVEKRCVEDDKLTTIESAEQFCSTTSMHNQLKKRGGWSNVGPQGPKSWWGSGFFGGWGRGGRGHGGRRGRPHWGWQKPGSAVVTVTVTGAAPAATPKPSEWVPNFQSGAEEWWKQQSAEWWKQNGHDWWRANGWHFPGPQWYWGKNSQWWQNQGPRWWQGPSARGRPGSWQGGRPWWPQAPPATQPEPVKPTSTPTTVPSDNQAWEDWPGWPSTWPSNNNPTGPTPTADPSNPGGWQGWTPAEPTSTPTAPTGTHTHPTWVPYTTTKPVQTVIPTGTGW